MVEVGGLMDVVCQKSGERGGARRCPVDQYSHRECMTLHMHLMNQQFYLLITHRDAHLHIPHTALKPFLAVQIMGRAISHNKSANCGNITLFFFFTRSLYLPLSCLRFYLLQVILHATHSAAYQ